MTTSWWQAAVSAEAAPADVPERADVAILGGGVAGCAVAYWLGRLAPKWRVVLLERGDLASGASGRNAGFLLHGTDADYARCVAHYGAATARLVWQFTRENRAFVAEDLDSDAFGLYRSGSLIAAGTPDEAARLQDAAHMLLADGAVVAYLDGAALARQVGTRGFSGALAVRDDGMLHPVRLVRHLVQQSRARRCTQTPVTALEPAGAQVRVVTPRGSLVADRVVVALNAYAPQVVPALGAYVRPVRAQMLATAPRPATLACPVYSHEGYYYVRQAPDGSVLVGGARHRHAEAEVGYEDATTDALQADLETYLAAHFPALAGSAVVRRWSGTMGFSPDGLPLYGPLPDHPASRWLGAFHGHGMGFAPRLARLVVEDLLGMDTGPYGRLFSVDRLAAPSS